MAKRVLKWNAQQIGDGIVRMQSATAPQTGLAIQTGLFQSAAAINGDSINMLYRWRFYLHMVRNDDLQLALAVAAIQKLAGLQGTVEVIDDDTQETKWRGINWWLAEAPEPDVAEGFGGRFIESWPIVFVGATEPESF